MIGVFVKCKLIETLDDVKSALDIAEGLDMVFLVRKLLIRFFIRDWFIKCKLMVLVKKILCVSKTFSLRGTKLFKSISLSSFTSKLQRGNLRQVPANHVLNGVS